MQRFLLLVCSLSLVLAGSFFSHQQGFADGVHQHSQPTNPVQLATVNEANEHSHFSPTQDQEDFNAGTLHCGAKILALIEWVEHRCSNTEQTIPIAHFSSRYGVWAMLDPPPPRAHSGSTATMA